MRTGNLCINHHYLVKQLHGGRTRDPIRKKAIMKFPSTISYGYWTYCWIPHPPQRLAKLTSPWGQIISNYKTSEQFWKQWSYLFYPSKCTPIIRELCLLKWIINIFFMWTFYSKFVEKTTDKYINELLQKEVNLHDSNKNTSRPNSSILFHRNIM